MSKRFTDSEKFRDTWYRKLKPKHKCLWEYFLAECSVAGTLEIDLDSISFHIGDKISHGDIAIFKDRIHFIKKNKIFIPYFIELQCSKKGKWHWNWMGGITPANRTIRNSSQYKTWRKSVYKRDNYKCQIAGCKANNLEAHHIKSFAKHPKERFNVANGITYCKKHHTELHKGGSDAKKNN